MAKQLRVIHAASMLKYRIGIVQQMQWESEAAQVLELPWKTQLYCPKKSVDQKLSCIRQSACVQIESCQSSLGEIRAWLKLQKEFYRWLDSETDGYDILMLRYSINDPFLYSFLRHVRIPTILVHHTLETFELAIRPSAIANLRAWAEKIMGKHSLRAASGIIGVTQEIVDYELKRRKADNIPTTTYPNGIYYEKTPAGDQRTETPELIMVASFFQAWHGLDLLLDSIEVSSALFTLHLVGELAAAHKARALRESRIRVHHSLEHSQIKRLAAGCWLGLSSFALHRNCMKQACTLKVREYLMMGIPVYADYEEIFPENFPFFYKGAADIENILLVAKKMRYVSREKVAETAKPYISKTALLAELHQWILASHDILKNKQHVCPKR